jgi:hypothetical protein
MEAELGPYDFSYLPGLGLREVELQADTHARTTAIPLSLSALVLVRSSICMAG